MAGSESKMYNLIDDLQALEDEGIPVFPGRKIINQKELFLKRKRKILWKFCENYFPENLVKM